MNNKNKKCHNYIILMKNGGLTMEDNKELIEKFDEKEVSEIFDNSSSEAEKLLNDADKMEKFLQKLEKKLQTVPIAGNSLAYVPLMISLVRSYVKKEYTEPPVTSMISIVIALIYVLSPIDLIPDTIPGAGLLEDGVIVAGCLGLVRTDLEDYRIWRKDNGTEFDDIPDYEEIQKQANQNSKFVNAFFKGKKSAKKK